MQDFSHFNFGNKTVGIVAHDAGAANHLIAWIAKGRFIEVNLKLSFHGPALVIAKELLTEFLELTIAELVSTCSVLIVGTGWQTDIEFNAVKIARKKSIEIISVLDHWTNYRQRFLHNKVEILPDHLWVVDEYAKAIATIDIASIPLSMMPNDYLESQVELVNSYKIQTSAHQKFLFLMEPIRDQWGPLDVAGEVLSFNYFIENIKLLSTQGFIEVIIRPHPSDDEEKYLSLLAYGNEMSVSISLCEKSILAEQIAWADIVVGCQTYAMVIALYAGKKVISAIPLGRPGCNLPFKSIVKLSNLA
jgi:hypothetical protein